MIPVHLVERIGDDLVDLGWLVVPQVPAVGDTIRLPDRPDDLAATVMGVRWTYGPLPVTDVQRCSNCGTELRTVSVSGECVRCEAPQWPHSTALRSLPGAGRGSWWHAVLTVHTGDYDLLAVETEST